MQGKMTGVPRMKLLVVLSLFAAILCPTVSIFGEKLSESRTLTRSMAFSGSGKRLIVDNVWGSVLVKGYAGTGVEMVAQETIHAKSSDRLERASREVKLEIYERPGEIELFVNGPFRCKDDRRHWADHGNPGYEVVYDFEIRVPFDTEIDVRTVNDGDIRVEDVRGDFRIHNVNGSIRMEAMAGSGEVETVNGPIVASFGANPTAASRFETINGRIDVSFRPDLSADLEMVARWGEQWSEFEVEALPSLPPTKRTKDGRTVIEIQKSSRVRVGEGGPTFSFETLNGNIYVRKGT